jgi:WD40 repeat protein
MKNFVLVPSIIVFFLLLTACNAQTSPTSSVPTPTETIVKISPIPDPVNITYGNAMGLDWSANSQQLSVLFTGGIVKFSTTDWQSNGEIPVDGINHALPFSVVGNIVQAVYSSDESYLSSLRANDFSMGSIESDYSIGIDTRNTILGLSVEHNLYVIQTLRCSAVDEDATCLSHYDLYTIKENERLFSLFEFDQELYESNTVIQYSADGRYLAAGADDNLIRIWDIKQKKLLFSALMDSDVYDLDFSYDDHMLLAAGNDATVRVWDIESGKELARLNHLPAGVFFARFIKNDSEILLGLKNGEYSRWEFDRIRSSISNPHPLFTLEPEYYFTPIVPIISISPNEKWIATINQYHVDIWNLETGQPFGPLPGFNSNITQIIHSPDGHHLAFKDDKHIYLYETQTHQFVGALPGPEQKYYAIAFQGDQPILVADAANQLIIWNFSSGVVQRFDETDDNPCLNMRTISMDGKLLVSNRDGYTYICDMETKKTISKVDNSNYGNDSFHFSDDGTKLLFLSDNTARLINTVTGEEIYKIIVKNGDISNQTDQFLVFPSYALYNLNNGATQKISTEIEPKRYASLNRNGRLIAVSDEDNIELYDILTGKLLQTIGDKYLTGLFFSTGDDILYGNHYAGVLKAWDLSTLTDPNTYNQIVMPQPTAISFPCSSGEAEPTATLEPTSDPKTIPTIVPTIASTTTTNSEQSKNKWIYNEEEDFGSPNPLLSSWSADEERVAVATIKQIDIFNVNTSRKMISLPIVGDPFAMSFSNDHNLLAVQIVNDRVELWDTNTGSLIHYLPDVGCAIYSLEFSVDDRTIHADCGREEFVWDSTTGGRVNQSMVENSFHNLMKWDGVSLRLYNQDGEILKTFEYPKQFPEKYFFSDDGNLLFIGYHPYTLAHSGVIINDFYEPAVGQIWEISNLENPVLLSSISTPKWNSDPYFFMDSPIAHFTSDNRYLFTSLDDETIRIWEVNTGNLITEIPGTSDFVLSKDQNRLETFDSTGAVSIWDISDRRHPVRIWQLAYSYPSVQQVLFTSSQDEIILLNGQTFSSHPLRNGIIQTTQEAIHLPYRVDQVITASQDGHWIGINQHGSVSICDRNQASTPCESLFTFPDRDIYLQPVDLAFSPDSRWLAASTPTGRVIYWDIATLTFHDLANNEEYYNLEFDPDGKHLLASSVLGDAILIEIKTREVIHKYTQIGDINFFVPNTKELVTIHENSNDINVIDLEGGTATHTFKNPRMINAAAIHPDGKHLIFSDKAGTYYLDLVTGKFLNQTDSVFYTIAISPDGSMMVTVDAAGQIQVWK